MKEIIGHGIVSGGAALVVGLLIWVSYWIVDTIRKARQRSVARSR